MSYFDKPISLTMDLIQTENVQLKQEQDFETPSTSEQNLKRRPRRNHMRDDTNDFQRRRRQPNERPDDRLNEKLMHISGPTYELPHLEMTEKKFSSRGRLYVGNIAPEVTQEELKKLFLPYGETSELFINKEKHFGFIKFDFHCSAERAKRELDGHLLKGRTLKIRFSPNGSTIKVKNLTPFVTNELLHAAFSIFGDIQRCVVLVDDRGKTLCEGVIEFARKGCASMAVNKCADSCFFLTSSLRPVIADFHEAPDDSEGFPEKNLYNRKSQTYLKEREEGPRFAVPGSFEHEYGVRWKQLHELHAQKEAALRKELELEKNKLEAQMEYARFEQETEMLREMLRKREAEKERQKREWEMKERQAEEMRQRSEDLMRRQEEVMRERMMTNEEDLRRRKQENTLFVQANQLNDILDQQEKEYDQGTVVLFGSEENERGYRYENRVADGNLGDDGNGKCRRNTESFSGKTEEFYCSKRRRY